MRNYKFQASVKVKSVIQNRNYIFNMRNDLNTFMNKP